MKEKPDRQSKFNGMDEVENGGFSNSLIKPYEKFQ